MKAAGKYKKLVKAGDDLSVSVLVGVVDRLVMALIMKNRNGGFWRIVVVTLWQAAAIVQQRDGVT